MTVPHCHSTLFFVVCLHSLGRIEAHGLPHSDREGREIIASTITRALTDSAMPGCPTSYRVLPAMLTGETIRKLEQFDLPDATGIPEASGLALNIVEDIILKQPATKTDDLSWTSISLMAGIRTTDRRLSFPDMIDGISEADLDMAGVRSEAWRKAIESSHNRLNHGLSTIISTMNFSTRYATVLETLQSQQSLSEIRLSLAQAISEERRTVILSHSDDQGTVFYVSPENAPIDGPYHLPARYIGATDGLFSRLPMNAPEDMIVENRYKTLPELEERLSGIPRNTRH